MRNVILILIFCNLLIARDKYIDENFDDIINKNSSFKIAILPIQNMSMYPDIPYHFRKHLKDILAYKGYSIISTDLIDKSLYSLGVQKADHIRLLNFNKLSNLTSADAILSGIIETATVQDAVVYSGYSFTASLKLQLRNGDTIWYNLSNRVAKRNLAFDPFNIALSFLSNRDESKHIDAIKAVAQNLLEDLPNSSRTVVVDDLLNRAIEIK